MVSIISNLMSVWALASGYILHPILLEIPAVYFSLESELYLPPPHLVSGFVPSPPRSSCEFVE
jgi:hypothetical protein